MQHSDPTRDRDARRERAEADDPRAGWRLDGFHLLMGAALVVLVATNLPGVAQQGGAGGTGTQAPPAAPAPQGLGAVANSDSNGSMIAVTGTDITGSCVLYLIDTESKQLAVYQATGGTKSLRGVELVGARRIDLDLQLEGYNDKSEYSYAELGQQFQKSGAR